VSLNILVDSRKILGVSLKILVVSLKILVDSRKILGVSLKILVVSLKILVDSLKILVVSLAEDIGVLPEERQSWSLQVHALCK